MAVIIAVIGFACKTVNSYDGEFGHGSGHGRGGRGLSDAQDVVANKAAADSDDTFNGAHFAGSFLDDNESDSARVKRSPHQHRERKHQRKRNHKRNKYRNFRKSVKSIGKRVRDTVENIKDQVQDGFNLFANALQNAVSNVKEHVRKQKERKRRRKQRKHRKHRKHH